MRKNRANGPTMLVILDGFGYRQATQYNAIAHAKTPHIQRWLSEYPHAYLSAAGASVGLLPSMIGNSEVGHMTIGAGRIIKQPVSIMHNTIVDKSFFKNAILTGHLQQLKKQDGVLHIMGLLSDAGVHSDLEQLYAYLDAAHQHKIPYVYIHPFLDGRDSPPKSAANYLEQLQDALTHWQYGSIGSIHGRFFAMDRDQNWQRMEKSYRVLTGLNPNNNPRPWQDVLEQYYAQGITDEFIPPTQIDPTSSIRDGDGIIFINFREDRARQLTAAFVDPTFNHFPTKKVKLCFFMTPIDYSAGLKTTVLFPTVPIYNTLKDVLAAHHKTIFSIAETEKYAHVTYFFTGGREEAVAGETRVLIPSLKAGYNYANHPYMSAPQITDAVIASLATNPCDFYLINYANADMVAHSGNFDATVKAITCLDEQLARLYTMVIEEMDGTLYITGDHGNAEDMYDQLTRQPKTAHTKNPVPFIMIRKGLEQSEQRQLPLKQLADIAPFILAKMKLPTPAAMQ